MSRRRLLLVPAFLLALAPGAAAQAPGSGPPAPPAASAAPAPGVAQAALQPFLQQHTLAGAVTLVASREEVLALEAVGFSNLAAARPMPPDALFWIASMSKPVTAAAFMLLVDEGKVSVEDPLEKYLPEFRDRWLLSEKTPARQVLTHPGQPILLRHLLTHTAGLPFRSAVEQPTLDLLPLRTAALSYSAEPLQSEPGTRFFFSNEGMNLIGRVVEVVSRMPFEKFVQQRLLDPLGMVDTTFLPTPAQLGRLATAYKPNAEKTGLEETRIGLLFYPLSHRRRQPLPAAGLFSTAADMGRFCRMILRGGELEGRRYLSEAACQAMTTRQTPPELPTAYGFGWMITGPAFGHGGAFSTNLTIDPAEGLATVFMAQQNGWPNGAGGQVQESFLKQALARYGHGAKQVPPPTEPPRATPPAGTPPPPSGRAAPPPAP